MQRKSYILELVIGDLEIANLEKNMRYLRKKKSS